MTARGLDHVGRERLEFDAIALDQGVERFDVQPFHFVERERGLRGAGVRDDRLLLGIEAVPQLQRNDAFTRTVRLVEAGRVIEIGEAIETERYVRSRTDELGTIDQARL